MTQASYDEIADWYNASIQANTLMHDLVLPPIFDLLGDVRGQRICDLACGQGVLSRALAERGAGVVGVDLSAKMLEIARQYEDAEPLGIVYLQDNAHTLTTLEDAAFHRTLSTYINTLAEAGLVLERLIEPQTTRDRDVRKGYSEVPALFVARCRKIYLR